jgi:hypothetical protein
MLTTDAVLTYHTDPYTCGVAKFNTMLARRLGVPCESLYLSDAIRPLVSVKPEEMGTDALAPTMPYDLFLHGDPRPQDAPAVRHATTVFCANEAIAIAVKTTGRTHNTRTVFCPSLLEPRPSDDPLVLLAFGMAHKLTRGHFEKVRDLLGDRPYRVDLSVAVHEGQPWGAAVKESTDLLREVFGARANPLGSLTDAELRKRLRACDWALLFYPTALRANNTTFWAALEERAQVLTNTDALSPEGRYYDITRLSAWPTPNECGRYTWDRLLQEMAS